MPVTVIAKHLIVTGIVQGVGFRHFVHRAAHDLDVKGWVRNRSDGTVEAMLAGNAEAVHALIERVRRGPRSATVSDVRVSDGYGSYERFDTLPTA